MSKTSRISVLKTLSFSECEAGKEHVDKKYILSFQTPIEGWGVGVLLL